MATKPMHAKTTKGRRSDSLLLGLTEKQRKAAEGVVMKGMTQDQALAYAGYVPNSRAVFQNPPVKAAMKEMFKQAEAHLKMDREKVLDGFMEAVEMAKIQADPEVMIQGWREIGRLCGYYAPEVKKIQLDVNHKRLMSQFETLTDEELLKIAADNAKQIEGEVIEVKESLKTTNLEALEAHVIEDLGK